ncbi:hypothetical protein [Iodidimonas nitroreducens]|nr:hypothetical protein [Iodidimonas nitroreducens]
MGQPFSTFGGQHIADLHPAVFGEVCRNRRPIQCGVEPESRGICC